MMKTVATLAPGTKILFETGPESELVRAEKKTERTNLRKKQINHRLRRKLLSFLFGTAFLFLIERW